jgi:HAD superfamily hydrolase (TIGR01549 family)
VTGASSSLSPPRALLLDVGLTFVHPSGDVMLKELRAHVPGFGAEPAELVAALVLAAEARHLRLPAGEGDDRVAATWGMLLGLADDVARRAWSAIVRRSDLYSELDPQAVPLLERARERGLALAAVSNSDGTLDAELRRFGLRECFDVVVDSTLAGFEKPDPRIYGAACDALGIPAADCWFVGDGLVNDVIGAYGAGVARAILYDRYALYDHLTGIARVRRLVDVLELIDVAMTN